jgi:hypothetical protein
MVWAVAAVWPKARQSAAVDRMRGRALGIVVSSGSGVENDYRMLGKRQDWLMR